MGWWPPRRAGPPPQCPPFASAPSHPDRPEGHNQTVIRGFATAEPLPDDALHAAGPPRYPRPSKLAEALVVSPAPAAKGAERLGLNTIGDLLEHLPRGRQGAAAHTG